MRILIAEDDAALAGFVRQGLQGEHYAVDVVEDGEQARAMGTEFDYDLVILDLNLLKLDGVSVLRPLRQKRPSQPVLVLPLASWSSPLWTAIVLLASCQLRQPHCEAACPQSQTHSTPSASLSGAGERRGPSATAH